LRRHPRVFERRTHRLLQRLALALAVMLFAAHAQSGDKPLTNERSTS
jgi:hypothetical protein